MNKKVTVMLNKDEVLSNNTSGRHGVRAFTLIELLVVVLIIGILSAIALPQYQKAVEKARSAEALQITANLRRAIDVYVLENGYTDISLAPELLGHLNCDEEGICYSKYFRYKAYCSSSDCQVYAYRYDTNGVNLYDFDWYKKPDHPTWDDKSCLFYEDKWEFLCTAFYSL